jgi:hypothetical protein
VDRRMQTNSAERTSSPTYHRVAISALNTSTNICTAMMPGPDRPTHLHWHSPTAQGGVVRIHNVLHRAGKGHQRSRERLCMASCRHCAAWALLYPLVHHAQPGMIPSNAWLCCQPPQHPSAHRVNAGATCRRAPAEFDLQLKGMLRSCGDYRNFALLDQQLVHACCPTLLSLGVTTTLVGGPGAVARQPC